MRRCPGCSARASPSRTRSGRSPWTDRHRETRRDDGRPLHVRARLAVVQGRRADRRTASCLNRQSGMPSAAASTSSWTTVPSSISCRATPTRSRPATTPGWSGTQPGTRSSSPARGVFAVAPDDGRRADAGDHPVHRHRRLDRDARAGRRRALAAHAPRAQRAVARRDRPVPRPRDRDDRRRLPGAVRRRRPRRPLRRGDDRSRPPLGIEIRAGLHTGEIKIVGGNVRGVAVHAAARIAALAGPGEVFVSGTTRDLLDGSGLRFGDRGLHELKGLDGPRAGLCPRAGMALRRSGHLAVVPTHVVDR